MTSPLVVFASALACSFVCACAVAAPAAQPAGTAAEPAQSAEPKVQRTVIQDDSTRIDELRVRGQTEQITVQPKGAKSYEIIPPSQGRDMSDSAGSQRGAAGKRVWHILSF